MKALLLALVAALVVTFASPASAVTLQELPPHGDGRVSVRFERGLDSLAEQADAEAERMLAEIGADLIGSEGPKHVVVQLVKDASSLVDVAPAGRGAPAYAIGVAYPDLGVLTVATKRGAQQVDPISTLRHELGHLALGAAVGDRAPRWLHEGFAAQHAHEWTWDRTELLAGMAWFGGVMPYDELDHDFPGEEAPATRAYAESEDFVGFLSRRGRWDDGEDEGDRWPFRHFLANLAHGQTIDDAARQAYGKGIHGLFDEWQDQLGKRYMWAPVGLLGLAIWVLCAMLLAFAWWRRRRSNRRRLAQWEREERAMDATRVIAPPYVPWPGEDPFDGDDDDEPAGPRLMN
nr:hypothetical protein [Kofleriaceae bacterium]